MPRAKADWSFKWLTNKSRAPTSRAAPRRKLRPSRRPRFAASAAPAVGAAKEVGRLIAERAVAAGIQQVVFDRGGYLYHGRVKALADAAREGGLDF